MSKVLPALHYTKEHDWVRPLAGQALEWGVTDHGQEALGDLVSVALVRVRVTDSGEWAALLTPVAYEALLKSVGGQFT